MALPSAVLFARSSRRRGYGLARYMILASMLLIIMLFLKASGETNEQRLQYIPPVPAWNDIEGGVQTLLHKAPAPPVQTPTNVHPIDILIDEADETFDALILEETHDIKTAAAKYRQRRGRHPPPGFDAWFEFAKERDAIIVEEFFDQIYHDLSPFWGLPAKIMRKEAWDYEMTINVRNGKATAGSDWFWTEIWLDLIQTIEDFLPDMDIPLNAMDEPRLVVPWEQIDEYMALERKGRILAPEENITSTFHSLPLPGQGETDIQTRDKGWENTKPYWKIAARGCHPESLAQKAKIITDFDHAPNISMENAKPHTFNGYVSNSSLSTDFCHQPDLQALHGALIEPLTISASKVLFPLFGGSKLPTNNEILLPAPMYWNNEERFSGGSDHGVSWSEKEDKVIWRGVATGGKNRATNWKGFQRHRFVAMINSTQAAASESSHPSARPENWIIPAQTYNIAAQLANETGPWLTSWSDAAFVDLNCEPAQPDNTCPYTDPYFSVMPGLPMASQFDNKYLPDIDGNSFSGRYRGFLLSTSLPIKATIFREWHDARLVAWKHFVPMDNRFMDFWGIIQYFVGYDGHAVNHDGAGARRGRVEGHDAQAEKIATEGKEWAERVLRREDMQIYVLRLLLEYARVSDDERDNMGFVADLL